jgi:hypothetical protein
MTHGVIYSAVKHESANTQHLAYEVLEHELRLTWLRNKRYTDAEERDTTNNKQLLSKLLHV